MAKRKQKRQIDALVLKNRELTYLLDNACSHTCNCGTQDKSSEWYAERDENKRKIEALKSQKKKKGDKLI